MGQFAVAALYERRMFLMLNVGGRRPPLQEPKLAHHRQTPFVD
jgi:hypothetical protein